MNRRSLYKENNNNVLYLNPTLAKDVYTKTTITTYYIETQHQPNRDVYTKTTITTYYIETQHQPETSTQRQQ